MCSCLLGPATFRVLVSAWHQGQSARSNRRIDGRSASYAKRVRHESRDSDSDLEPDREGAKEAMGLRVDWEHPVPLGDLRSAGA